VAEAASWLEIDLPAIVANARALAAKAQPASLCAVIKSNAYGHGLVRVGQALAGAGIAGLRLAVFSAREGLALRAADIALPILVVGPVAEGELAEAARARLELALLDAGDIEAFARHKIRAHVKIDTGIRRFGIAPKDAAAVLARCRERGVAIAGIYSHLANAEDLDKPFTLRQVEGLREASRSADKPLLHIAASAAAMMWPETRLDMVRCGIALYGRWPSPQVEAVLAGDDTSFVLRPALRWFAPIVQLRDVAAGDSVGYGRAFVAARDSRIAVLPLGYADGLPRAAGAGAMHVRLASGRAPIAGRICMNACMIDVTGLAPAPSKGERVELEIEPAALAAGTINYEILAALPDHLERRYA
jgi:alanine racemase